MRNVLVSSAASPLGRRLLEHLRGREGLGRIVGIGSGPSPERIAGVELVRFEGAHGELVELLRAHEIDTVIHCGLAPDRNGSRAEPSEAGVIDTMRLGSAIGSEGSLVRAWIVASSTDVYPVTSRAPRLQREDGSPLAGSGGAAGAGLGVGLGIGSGDETRLASLLEAEDYVRDVAARAPHLNVAILRLQQLVGEGVRSPMAALLGQPVMPRVLGFDAPIQMLALDDAVRALAFAAEVELAGVYNVSSSGTIRLRDAIRVLERRALPILPLEAGLLTPLARRLGVPHVPGGMLGPLRFGNAVDTSKLAAAGFHPEYDQAACLASLHG